MSKFMQLKERISRRLAILVAAGVALLAVVLWQALISNEHDQIKLAVEQETLTLRTEISERIEPKILALVRMGRRWEAREGIPREEWGTDAAANIVHQPGLRGIAWVDPSYILRWTPPLEGRKIYEGQNAGRNELRRAALEAARELREVQVTRATELSSGNKGFLAFVPLFVGERFDGYIAGIFRISELLDPLLSEHASLGYSIALFDGEEEIANRSDSSSQEYPEWLEETQVEIRNIHWRIQVWPKPELIANVRSSLPEVALAAGLLLAFLLSVAIRQTQSSRLRAQEVGLANQELEKQIGERQRTEETLRESTERYSLAVRGTSDGLWDWNIKSGEEYFSPRWKEMLGYQDHELRGHYKEWFDRVHPEDRSRMMRCLDNYLANQSDTFDTEHRLLHKDGTYRWFRSRGICLRDAEGKPYRMAGSLTDITGRKQAEQALRESEDRFRAQYKGIPIPTYSWQLSGEDFVLMDYNDAAHEITRGGIAQFIGKTAGEFFADRPDIVEEMLRCYQEKTPIQQEVVLQMRTTGQTRCFAVSGAFVPPDLVMVHTEDITERKQMEETLRERDEQLLQAQKMEAIGQLAGGVAHDFNNLLTSILGYADLLAKKLKTGRALGTEVSEIRKAGEQAASLTGQLLAFSRKQVLQLQVLDLNDIVNDMSEMLRRLIGEDIELVIDLSPALGNTKADPAQIKQLILNLAGNARDAMPSGGRLTIATDTVELAQSDVPADADAKDNRYVKLTLSDTGEGMDEETLAHIFEPFFTTKEPGKGTGLGLASVYGVVKQSGGHIQVSSLPQRGTTFHIYLPQVSGPAHKVKQPDSFQASLRGEETLLLVEDDDMVRNLAKECLEEEGYTVLAAQDADEAIRIFRQMTTIHLLVTDVVMPGMSGPELAQQLVAHRKDMKVLYTSGYPGHPLVRNNTPKEEISYLPKPFTPEQLLLKVRKVLDTTPDSSAKKQSRRKRGRHANPLPPELPFH